MKPLNVLSDAWLCSGTLLAQEELCDMPSGDLKMTSFAVAAPVKASASISAPDEAGWVVRSDHSLTHSVSAPGRVCGGIRTPPGKR